MEDPWSRFITEFDEAEVTLDNPFGMGLDQASFHERLQHSPTILHDLIDGNSMDCIYGGEASRDRSSSTAENPTAATATISPSVLRTQHAKKRPMKAVQSSEVKSTSTTLEPAKNANQQTCHHNQQQQSNNMRFQQIACPIAPLLSKSTINNGASVAIQFMPQISPSSSSPQQPSPYSLAMEMGMEGGRYDAMGFPMQKSQTPILENPIPALSPSESAITSVNSPSCGIQLPANELPRRDAHIASEQRRRAMMRNHFEYLQRLLPPSEYRKPSKANLLHSAVKHIQSLQRANSQFKAQLIMINNENIRLHQQLQSIPSTPDKVLITPLSANKTVAAATEDNSSKISSTRKDN